LREFEISVRVYYEDTDFSGVVYHARYLHFFERGRTEALRSTGVTHCDLAAREDPLMFAIREMDIKWASPARNDDLLTVRTVFLQIRGARMMMAQSIYRDETLLAEAAVEAVSVSLDGRPRRVPDELVKQFMG
jgi:acyl-CoA thioester hydrolase